MLERSAKKTLNSPLGRVLLAQALSSVGTSVSTVALAYMVFAKTGSVLHMGAVLAASTLPVVVMAFFGGALLDRYGGRSVMVTADICRAGVIVLMPFAAEVSVGYIYLLGVVIGTFSALFNPGQVKLVSDLVSRENLMRANSYLSIAREGCELGGYLIGGFLVASLGVTLTFALDAASYLVSAALLLTVHPTPVHKQVSAPLRLLLRQSPQALRTIWNSPTLRTNTLLALLPMTLVLTATPNAYALALQIFNKGAEGLGFMEVVTSLGWILGGVLASRFIWRGDRNSYVVLSIFCMSACFALVSVSPWFWMAVLLLALSAVANVGAIVGSMTLFQEIEDRPDKGRVIAVRSGMGQLSATVGLLMGGVLGELLGVRTLFLFAGVMAVGLAAVVYLPYRFGGTPDPLEPQTDGAP